MHLRYGVPHSPQISRSVSAYLLEYLPCSVFVPFCLTLGFPLAGVAAGTIAVAAAGKAVFGASVFLGAALSGLNGGIANASQGNSYINGYAGGTVGGAIQSANSKTVAGTILGGGAGVAVGTAITGALNNLDPDSSNLSVQEITENAVVSGGKALATSSLTAFMGYASDLAVIDGARGAMPSYTLGFSESVKAFFGAVDDAIVYIWE